MWHRNIWTYFDSDIKIKLDELISVKVFIFSVPHLCLKAFTELMQQDEIVFLCFSKTRGESDDLKGSYFQ